MLQAATSPVAAQPPARRPSRLISALADQPSPAAPPSGDGERHEAADQRDMLHGDPEIRRPRGLDHRPEIVGEHDGDDEEAAQDPGAQPQPAVEQDQDRAHQQRDDEKHVHERRRLDLERLQFGDARLESRRDGRCRAPQKTNVSTRRAANQPAPLSRMAAMTRGMSVLPIGRYSLAKKPAAKIVGLRSGCLDTGLSCPASERHPVPFRFAPTCG